MATILELIAGGLKPGDKISYLSSDTSAGREPRRLTTTFLGIDEDGSGIFAFNRTDRLFNPRLWNSQMKTARHADVKKDKLEPTPNKGEVLAVSIHGRYRLLERA